MHELCFTCKCEALSPNSIVLHLLICVHFHLLSLKTITKGVKSLTILAALDFWGQSLSN